jgi:hypothetical protein
MPFTLIMVPAGPDGGVLVNDNLPAEAGIIAHAELSRTTADNTKNLRNADLPPKDRSLPAASLYVAASLRPDASRAPD